VHIRHILVAITSTLIACSSIIPGRGDEAKTATAVPHFRMQEIETGLSVGYAVLLVDVNGDGKNDIVVVDTNRVLWYENPTWKRRTILQGQTKPDNVCIAALDIDGDGQLDFALGADWHPANTKSGGTLQWLKRGKTLDEPWTMYPIAGDIPTLHRIRFADIDGNGKPALIVTPLQGRNCTARGNWMDGAPVTVLAYRIPKDPTRDRWVPEILDQSMHVVHNFWPVPTRSMEISRHPSGLSPRIPINKWEQPTKKDLLLASYEGVNLLSRDSSGNWTRIPLAGGNQDTPKGTRGSSEIKSGTLKNGKKFIATIEPWHGHQVVVYSQPDEPRSPWERHVIDDKLKWGHAVWCADLDGDGNNELIIGVRDDLSKKPTERRGVRIYKCLDDRGVHWSRHFVDPGGVAVEDMAVADLNNDGRVDIVAVGRQTGNIRIYWNESGK
jgi:FG-GAP-like repeat